MHSNSLRASYSYKRQSSTQSNSYSSDFDLSNFPDEPIQLISIDDKGKCGINNKAISMLSKIQTKVGVITVAGPYRTGKSFLLNRLLGRQQGFEIGSTVQSCTRGLWIWGRPIKVSSDMYAILMDTEGLGSCNRDQQIDVKIFSLALLLSSYFVYNCMNAIDENALEALSLVVNLSKHIHVSSKPSNIEEDAQLFAKYFPCFMWVIRDFALQLVDDDEREINAKTYLENALRPVELSKEQMESNESLKRKNEIRNILSVSFAERDCTVLFRPISDERKLREINNMPYETLRPQFRGQVEDLIKKVFYGLKPKVLEGQALTGKMFSELCVHYVQAMNSEAVPTISTAWERVIDSEISRIQDKAVNELKGFIQNMISPKLPLENQELNKLLKQGRAYSLTFLNSITIANAPPEKLVQLRQNFDQFWEEVLDQIQENNWYMSEKECEDMFIKLHEKIQEKVVANEYKDFRQLNEDWEFLRRVYRENARGPAKYDVIGDKLGFAKFQEDVDSLFYMNKIENEKELTEQKQKYQVAQSLCDNAKEMLKEEKDKNFEVIKNLREQGNEQRLELERKVDDLKNELSIKEDQIRRLEFEVEKQQKLAQVTAAHNQAIAMQNIDLGIDGKEIKQFMALIGNQLKDKEMENIKLKLSKDYELKCKDLEKTHFERLTIAKQEAKRAFDITLDNVKTIYEDEIKALKAQRKDLEEKSNQLKRELVKKEGDIQLLQERIKSQEKEKNLKLEHAQLLCKLSNALKGYADALENQKLKMYQQQQQ